MKRKTNVQIIREIMERSKYGAMVQAFVVEALTAYSEQVMQEPIESFPKNPLFNPRAWKGCAEEVHTKLKLAYDTKESK